jgi:hypothetical protein
MDHGFPSRPIACSSTSICVLTMQRTWLHTCTSWVLPIFTHRLSCKQSAEACTAMTSRTRLTSIRNWVAMKNSMASSGSCSSMTWVYCSTSCQITWRPRARIPGGWTCWKMVLDLCSRRTLMSIGTRRAALWRIACCCQFLEGPTRRRLRAANCGSPMDEADSS